MVPDMEPHAEARERMHVNDRGRFVASFSGTDKAVCAATCMPLSPLQLLTVRFDPHCSGHLLIHVQIDKGVVDCRHED